MILRLWMMLLDNYFWIVPTHNKEGIKYVKYAVDGVGFHLLHIEFLSWPFLPPSFSTYERTFF